MDRHGQSTNPWGFSLLVLLVLLDVALSWLELIQTGIWTFIFSSGYRLEGFEAIAWLGLKTSLATLLVLGGHSSKVYKVLALEIILGFLMAGFDLSVYWRADCGCVPVSNEVYLRMVLRSLELILLVYLRR
jgi:hypothetical protein